MFNIKLLYFITQDKIIYLYEYIIKYNKRKTKYSKLYI
jgi:hypothetical protein